MNQTQVQQVDSGKVTRARKMSMASVAEMIEAKGGLLELFESKKIGFRGYAIHVIPIRELLPQLSSRVRQAAGEDRQTARQEASELLKILGPLSDPKEIQLVQIDAYGGEASDLRKAKEEVAALLAGLTSLAKSRSRAVQKG